MDALADQTTPVACVVEDCLELSSRFGLRATGGRNA